MVFQNYSQNRWNSDSNVSKNNSKPCASDFRERRVKKLIQKYEDLSVSAKNNNSQSVIKHSSSEQYISKRNSAMLGDSPILDKNSVLRFLSLEDHQTNNKYVLNEFGKNDCAPNSYSARNIEDNCDTKMPSHSKSSSKSNFKIYADESERDRNHQSQDNSPSNAKRNENNIWKIFTLFNEPDKDKKHDNNRIASNTSKKDTTNYKYTPDKLDKDRKQDYANSLPTGKKKQENSFGKNFIRSFSATTSRDKKLKPLSNSNQQYNHDNKVKTLPKDGSTTVKTRNETLQPQNRHTGAIKKQLSTDDVIYRKRRNSYLMATQDDNHRKLKIYPDKKEHNPEESYVSKTISKFETQNDIMTVVDLKVRKSKNKFEHDIKQLFQQYHNNKKFGTSNKMTREELSLEIDNVLLNKFKQISSDNPQDMSSETSGAGNHSNLHQNIDSTPQSSEEEKTITLVLHQPEEHLQPTRDTCLEGEATDIQTDYVIIVRESTNELSSDVDVDNTSHGQSASKLNLDSTDSEPESEINVREKLSAQLTKVLSNDNLQNSVEDLFNNIQKDLDVINESLSEFGVEIKEVSVIDPDDENMYENFDCYRSVSCPNNLNKTEERIYENIQYIQEKIKERQQCPTQKNICEYSENITEFLRDSDETKPKIKVSNLVSYFTDKIAEVSEENKRISLENRKSISSNKTYINDEVFSSPTTEKRVEEFRYSTVSTPETNNIQKENYNLTYSSDTSSSSTSGSYEEHSEKIEETTPEISFVHTANPPVIKISYTADEEYLEENETFQQASNVSFSSSSADISENNSESRKILPEQNNFHGRQSFSSDKSSEENYLHQYSTCNLKAIRTLSVQEQAEQLKKELKNEEIRKRQRSFNIQRKDSGYSQDSSKTYKGVIVELKPRLSRLYTAKFTSNTTKCIAQDTNNNDCNKTSQTQQITNAENNQTLGASFEATLEASLESTDIIALTNEETTEKEDTLTHIEILEGNAETNSFNLTEDPKKSNEDIDEVTYDFIKEDSKKSKEDIDQVIYDFIKEDALFYSDSDGDYDITETYNYDNSKFFSLQRRLSTSDWVQNTVSQIERYKIEEYDDFDENEDTEHIYERIKRSGSSGTLHTIYDEQNNPAIRISMLDVTGEYEGINEEQMHEQKIEESEKELRKNIEEIQDNSKKACLINELVTTEKNYINKSLHRLVHDYMPEMDKTDIPKGLVGKGRQIFGNADIIFEGHKDKFLPDLEKHTCIEDLAICFLKHETIFKLYPLYSKNKPKSDIVLRDYSSFFKARQDALNDKLDLASYLLTPIQRLAKYCLLVKSLVKECEKENIVCDTLKCALEMLNKQMRMGNDLIALDSIVAYNGNIRDQGEVLLRDTFVVQPPNKKPTYEGMIFLFQECLIITAVNRQDFMETFIYKESFQLTDMGYSDIESEPLEFSVWYRKRDVKKYQFRTKNQDIKQKWVKEIFNLLWKQLEANKRRKKKELEENGVRDTRVPVVRPYSVPNKGQHTVKRKDSGSSSKKSSRKNTLNSSADTIWYTRANT